MDVHVSSYNERAFPVMSPETFRWMTNAFGDGRRRRAPLEQPRSWSHAPECHYTLPPCVNNSMMTAAHETSPITPFIATFASLNERNGKFIKGDRDARKHEGRCLPVRAERGRSSFTATAARRSLVTDSSQLGKQRFGVMCVFVLRTTTLY